MPCYCSEIKKLKKDINTLSGMINDLSSLSESFLKLYNNQKENLKDFFSEDGYCMFRINELAKLTENIDNYEKNLCGDFTKMIDDISTDLRSAKSTLSRWESSDSSYHASLK